MENELVQQDEALFVVKTRVDVPIQEEATKAVLGQTSKV